jgi:adenosylcobyric acid synthase
VAPFKAQNMSNNSFVTIEGGEIGRAQVAQAEACGLAPSVHMNPILLKPSSDMGAQVVLQGHVLGTYTAREYYAMKGRLRDKVAESYRRLTDTYDTVVMEGAGSCCEVNLRAHDLVNFEMALTTRSPVIIVADIDRGGVFAQIIGSMAIISPEERDLVAGFLINKFRGDPSLFESGIEYLEEKTGKPVLGLVPWYSGFHIDTEDSMSLDQMLTHRRPRPDKINIAAVRLPHVSNFTDLEVLMDEPDVLVNWLEHPHGLESYDGVVLPGSKSVIDDLIWLKKTKWTDALRAFADNHSKMVIGLCGGFQMLGTHVADPLGIEGTAKQMDGLGLLTVTTIIEPTKIVRHTRGRETVFNSMVSGYEIHMGRTQRPADIASFVQLPERNDGAVNTAGNVFGTYLHGLFDAGEFRGRLLSKIGAAKGLVVPASRTRTDRWVTRETHYDLLAAHFEKHVNMDEVIAILEAGRPKE